MAIKWVRKNNGETQPFRADKIRHSLASTLHHADSGEVRSGAERFTREAVERLEGRGRATVTSDDIRHAIIHVLREAKQDRVAELYELTSLHMIKTTLHSVIKRNGTLQSFHPYKLFKAIKHAFSDAGLDGGKVAEQLTHEISLRLADRFGHAPVPVTEIRKLTLTVLSQRGFHAAERMYLLHKYL